MPNPKARILLVEDDRDIAKLLRYNLEKDGYAVTAVEDGEAAVGAFRREKPRIVILDLMLPKVDGLEVCRLIRSEDKSVAVMMLTAKGTEVDKVVGLEMGADDYVSKPFSIREVLARVKSLLRRVATTDTGPAGLLKAGRLELNVDRHEVKLKGKPLKLAAKEFEFLKTLWLARGKTLTRDELLERVWGFDRASEVDTRTIDQHVARLRAKLGPERERICTVKSYGYRFVPDE